MLIATQSQPVQLLLFGSQAGDLLLPPVHLNQEFTSPDLLGVDLQDFLEGLPRLAEREVMDMLLDQAKPVFGLAHATLLFNGASQTQRFSVVRVYVERLFDFLKRQRE